MAAQSVRRPGGETASWRVLIADAAGSTRALLAETVRQVDPRAGILEAGTGREAVEHLLAYKPEIVFVALQLPDITGAEALAIGKLKGVRPVSILMSDMVLSRWVDLSTELEAYEFLKKPLDPDHVVKLLRAARRLITPARTLLIEESAPARQVMRRMLDGSQFTLAIDETEDARHGLKLMRLAAYDLVILDASLSGGNGLEIACQAREISPGARILLTAGGDMGRHAPAAKQFGIAALLAKPFYPRDVNIALHAAFELRRPYLLNALRKTTTAAAVQPEKLVLRQA